MSNLSELLPAGGAAKEFEVVASGTLPNGKPVVMKADGTVEVVTGQTEGAGSESTFSTNTITANISIYDPDSKNVVIAYIDSGDSNKGKAVVASISGTTISYGSAATFESGSVSTSGSPAGGSMGMCYDTSNNKVVISYADLSNSSYGTCVIGTVSGTSISFGTPVVYYSGTGTDTTASYDTAQNKVLIVFKDGSDSHKGAAFVGTVSGTSISFGSKVTFFNGQAYYNKSIYDETAGKHIVALTDVSASFQGESLVGTISGTSVSFGSNVSFSSNAQHHTLARDTGNNKTVFFYQDAASSDSGQARVASLSGTTLSFGTEVTYNSGNTEGQGAAYDVSSGKVIVAYRSGSGVDSADGFLVVGSISGTDISFESEVEFNDADTTAVSLTYNPEQTKNVIAYRDIGDSSKGNALVYSIAATNVADFVGITAEAITSGATGVVVPQGGVAASVANTPLQLQPFGSAAVFKAANTGNYGQQSVFLKSGEKFVTIYSSASNSNYGTARVGAVSGTSISYGSESVFNSGAVGTDISIASDPNTADKFIVCYKDLGNSNYGTAIVGTVSGTSISFGSEVVFASATTGYVSVSFDPNTANKFIIAYRDEGNLNKGTAIVGTVSGTSLSFGNEVIFNNGGNSSYIDAKFDPSTANKFVVAYQDQANSAYGTAIVGVVSGTNISFGSAAVFNSSNGNRHIGCSFDPNTANKFVVAYRDGGNSNFGSATVGTVSGTSISYGSKSVFNTSASNYIGIDFDPINANTFVVAYSDGDNYDGYVQIGTVSGTSTSYGTRSLYNSGIVGSNSASFNPTGNKFVVAYSDGSNSGYGTAIIGSLSDNLTIGSTYYVQSDGSVSTVSTSPAVILGKAVSSTSLILKGNS